MIFMSEKIISISYWICLISQKNCREIDDLYSASIKFLSLCLLCPFSEYQPSLKDKRLKRLNNIWSTLSETVRVWSTLDYKKSVLARCLIFPVDCSIDRRREFKIQIVRSISWLGLILEFCNRRLGETGQFAYISFKGRERNILVSKGQLESETQSHTDNVAWQCQLWYLPNWRCLAQTIQIRN